MLLSKNRRKRLTPPPPDYARYKPFPISGLTLGNRDGKPFNLHDRGRILACGDRWRYAFVYDKFDEWGTIEVDRWCEDRWGRSFEHVKNSKRHNAKARWWALNGDITLFSDEIEALEFKLRWV